MNALDFSLNLLEPRLPPGLLWYVWTCKAGVYLEIPTQGIRADEE